MFPGEGKGVLSDKSTGYAIDKICKSIGMRHLHNHVLRHTFASHAVMHGIPLRQVQDWLGHANITVTMRYAHLARGVGDELIQRLAPRPGDGEAQP